MSLNDAAFYAALSEEVYNRYSADRPLSLASITAQSGHRFSKLDDETGLRDALSAKGLLVDAANSFVYSANGDGFAAQVLFDNTTQKFIVVFRGTDWGSQSSGAAATDNGDFQADLGLGSGSSNNLSNGPTSSRQLADLQKVMDIVIEQAGSASNVIATGQSLGGGLAGLATAIYGVQSYLYDAAPFQKEIATIAIQEAAQKFGLQWWFQPLAVDNLIAKSPAEQRTALTALLSTDPNAAAKIDGFLAREAANLAQFPANMAYATAYQINGEILSKYFSLSGSGVVSWIAQIGATAFQDVQTPAAAGDNVGAGNAVSLHHPSLIALGLKDSNFGELTRSDAAIRNALFENQKISGPVEGDRADPVTLPSPTTGADIAITSRVGGGAPQPAILYRALWLNDTFETTFVNRFKAIDSGSAGDGLSADVVQETNLHTGLVYLGLETVRDAIRGSGEIRPAGLDVFGNVDANHYAMVRLDDISTDPRLSQAFGEGPSKTYQPFGKAIVDSIFKQDVLSDVTNSVANALVADTNGRSLLKWDVLVVQAGDSPMDYAPAAQDAKKSHLIFGGTGSDVIADSAARDYIVGGGGGDIYHLGGGRAGIGDGVGDIVAGRPGDTADYLLCNRAVDITLNAFGQAGNGYFPSDNPDGRRHDVLIGVDHVIGSGYDDKFFLSLQAPAAIDGAGGYNTVFLPFASNACTILGSGFSFLISAGATTYLIQNIQEFDFSNETLSAGALTESHGGLAFDERPSEVSSSLQATFYDYAEWDGAHSVQVIHLGDGLQYGALAGFISVDPTHEDIEENGEHTGDRYFPGTVDFTFTVDEGALAAAPKGNFSDFYQVTIEDADGHAISSTVGISIQGLAPTYEITSAETSASVSESLTSADEQVATGVIGFSDTDAYDAYHAEFNFVQSDGGSAPIGEFSAEVSGGGEVHWTYVADQRDLRALPDGTTVHETYQVRIVDEFGDAMTQNVVLTVNAAPAETSITGADSFVTLHKNASQAGIEVASGTVSFADDNLFDIHDLSTRLLVSNPGTDPGSFSAWIDKDSNSDGTGLIHWSYSVDDADLVGLSAGQWITSIYDMKLDDGRGGAVEQTVFVAVQGNNTVLNHAPQIVGGDTDGAVAWENSGTEEHATGTLIFGDGDPDSHSISVDLISGGTSDGSPFGTLSASIVSDVSDVGSGGEGIIHWNYSATDAAIANIAPGSPAHEVYRVTIDDGHGGTATQDIFIDLTGRSDANDPPEVVTQHVVSSGFLVQDWSFPTVEAAVGGDEVNHVGYGGVTFSDADGDALTATSNLSLVRTFDSETSTLTLTTEQQNALFAGFSMAQAADQNGDPIAGSYAWTYDASGLTFMTHGQLAVLTADVVATDGFGGSVDQSSTIIAWGQDATPAIVDGMAGGTAHQDDAQGISGSIGFSDADAGDEHRAASLFRSSDGPTADQANIELGSFHISVAAEPGDGSPGTMDWTYVVDPAKAQMLGEGETATEVYDAAVTDDVGGTHYFRPEFTIVGANDTPTVGSLSGGSTSQVNGQHLADDTFHFADADWTDTHSVSSSLLWSDGGSEPFGEFTASINADTQHGTGGIVGLEYRADDGVLTSLAIGQTVHELFDVEVQDEHGAVVHKQIAASLTNDQILFGQAATVVADQSEDGGETASGMAIVSVTNASSAAAAFVAADDGNVPLGAMSASVVDGQVVWSYTAEDDVLAVLQDGQTVHEFWKVDAVDVNGGTHTESIEVAVSRAADRTTVTSADATGTVVENATISGTETAAGAVAFLDGDHLDAHTVSTRFVAGEAGQSALGVLTASVQQDTTGSGAGGATVWNFSVTDEDLAAHLRPGQIVHETFAVDLSDGHGGITTENVVIGLSGAQTPAGSLIVDGGPPPGSDPIGGPILYGPVTPGVENAVFDSLDAPWMIDAPQYVGRAHLAGDADGLTYSLVGPSAEFFTIDASGNVSLNAGAELDFQTWRQAVVDAIGSDPGDQVIYSALADGGQSLSGGAQLLQQFAGTPYEFTVRATDGQGAVSEGSFLVPVRDVANDYAHLQIATAGSVSEFSGSGTVVAFFEGLAPNEPFMPMLDWDGTGYFQNFGNEVVTTRPMNYSVQSHFDLTLEAPTAPSDGSPYWGNQQVALPVDVLGSGAAAGDPTAWTWSPAVAAVFENPTQDVLVGTVHEPAGFNGWALVDGEPDQDAGIPSGSFEMRGDELWLKGGSYLDREALGPDGVLPLTIIGYDFNGGEIVKSEVPVSVQVANVDEGGPQAHIFNSWIDGGSAPAGYGFFSLYDPDGYDDQYSVHLVSGMDDSDLFAVTYDGSVSNNGMILPSGLPFDFFGGEYTIDLEVTGTSQSTAGYDHIFQLPIHVWPAAPSAPEFVSGDTAGAGAASSADQISGAMLFNDVDQFSYESHTTSASFVSSDLEDGQQIGSLTAQVTADDRSSGEIDVDWQYHGSSAMSSLSEGQTAHENYLVTVTDAFGLQASQAVTIEITGENDAPSTGSLQTQTATQANGQHIADDTFHFADVNWNDTHSVSASLSSSDGGSAPLGELTASINADTLHGTGGIVGLEYHVDDGVLASLVPGQTVHELFDVALQDNHGAIAHQQVAINLTHDNLLFV